VTQIATLDAAEITAWLTRVTQTIDRSLRDSERAAAVAHLRTDLETTKVGLPVLAQLALLDDCLRAAHIALDAGRKEVSEPDHVPAVAELVRVALPKYFAVLPEYDSFDEDTTPGDIDRFFTTHHADKGAFGYRNSTPWRGLVLARHVERTANNTSPLRELERMLVRIMDEVFGGRASKAQHEARRRLRDLFEPPANANVDPRDVAFCRSDGPEVFSSVAHGSQIHERDPFDVESIHGEAREVFHRLLVRATTPEQHRANHGRTLLVLGDSGSGKTHLLRALRYQVHAQRLGYVGYMQMTSEVGEYARYVLRNLVDSLERPYDAPTFHESGLLYLSDGLAESRGVIPPADLERLRNEVLEGDELDTLIGGMIDRLLRAEGLESLEPDLVHALLLLQRRDPALQRRVIRFLRCEQLTPYEQRLLGGLAPRDQPEDPLRTIRQLGAIAYELQLAALVLLVDQVEDTVPDGKTVTRLQQAVDVLRAIADAVPSAIVVMSCLDDVYTALRGHLSRSLVDRLERDPAPVRLQSQRERGEIEQLLIRRLDHLYAHFDVAIQDDEPLYPFQPDQIDAVTQFRARDAIARFRDFHEACIAAGGLVKASTISGPMIAVQAPPAPDLDRAWNDALAGTAELPDDDSGLVDLVAQAMRDASDELGMKLDVRREGARLYIEGKTLQTRLVELCNHNAQGGHLGSQLDALRRLAKTGVVPVALRTSDFQFKPKTKIAKQVGEFVAAGGVPVVLEQRQLRAVAAARSLAREHATTFPAWRRANRPLSHLAFVRAMLDLDRAPRAVVHQRRDTKPVPEPRPPAPPRASTQTGPQQLVDKGHLRLGETTTMRKDPVPLPLDQVTRHLAFLGSPGSGKTMAALAVIEQLLERGVSALLVDRRGDLARYASEAWWRADDADRERKERLRAAIDIALYTPGNPQGRPLRLPLVPPLEDTTTQEREQLAKFAASGLAAMMGYGGGATHRHKESILQCAIQLHADERDITVDALCDTINMPDPELLTAVGSLQRFFAPLSEDLQSLKIQRGSLLGGDGEALDVAALLPPVGGRPRLTVINTAGLAEIPVLQFWVSRLLIDLARLARVRPNKALQAVVFLDEADAYVPALGSPPTKEPMFDLLRRARSSGIGMLLATQNPGDLDYKARELIGTWLVGKVTQDRALEKMRHLLASYPNVASRLATQPTGYFFVLANDSKEIRCDRALMTTEQLADHEVTELARAQRRSP
jgi:adenylylsulfate kinase-like enzyme